MRLLVQTTYLPEISAPLDGVPGGADASKPDFWTQLLKPKVQLEGSPLGAISWAPAGEPGESKWPMVKLGLVVVAGLALYGLFKLIGGK